VASRVALDLLNWAMRSAPHRLGCAFLGTRNSRNGLLRFGEFAGTLFHFPQESLLNAVQMVQEYPKIRFVFMGKEFLQASTSFRKKTVDKLK